MPYRKKWSFREKCQYIQILNTPLVLGSKKPIKQFSEEYGVPLKTIYKWQKLYETGGFEALKSNSKKTRPNRVHSQRLVEEVEFIALHHPELSASNIINSLKNYQIPVSVPTVQSILTKLNLGKSFQRFANTERNFLRGDIHLSKNVTNLIFANNKLVEACPLNLNMQDGVSFFITCIPLHNYSKLVKGIVLFAIETNSIYPFLYYWDGANKFAINEFIEQILLSSDSTNKIKMYLHLDKNLPRFTSTVNHRVVQTLLGDRFSKIFKSYISSFKKRYLKGYAWTDEIAFQHYLTYIHLREVSHNFTQFYPQYGLEAYGCFRDFKSRMI